MDGAWHVAFAIISLVDTTPPHTHTKPTTYMIRDATTRLRQPYSFHERGTNFDGFFLRLQLLQIVQKVEHRSFVSLVLRGVRPIVGLVRQQ